MFKRFLSITALISISFNLSAQFFDQGLTNPNPPIRSDFSSSTKGTASNPITFNSVCLFPGSGCPPSHSGVFNQANWWGLNGGGTASNYWVTHFNMEDWRLSLSGPPSQSLPRSQSGQGVYGLEAGVLVGGENFPRIHMNLRADLIQPGDTSSNSPIPFMSVGAEANRGNGGPIGYMRLGGFSYTPVLEFTSKLWCSAGSDFHNHFFYVWTEWGGIPRMVMVALYGSEPAAQWLTPPGSALHTSIQWNWPIQESWLNPGAEIAYTNIEALAQSCNSVPTVVLSHNQFLNWSGDGSEAACNNPASRDERTYRLNVQNMFRCLSNAGGFSSPFPANQTLPIRGIHWANEAGILNGTGIPDAKLWTSIHGMKMDPPL